jgi:hypothetical protein
MRLPVGVIIEFPEVYKLIDCAGVALEIPDELFPSFRMVAEQAGRSVGRKRSLH